jgi:RNA polymerase sigma-70 factor (ECF subfamily)
MQDQARHTVTIIISVEIGIDAARSGSRDALGQILEGHRPYLSKIARSELGDDLEAKVSASDLVQETFLKAHRDFEQFDGQSASELRAWLRQILHNSLGHLARDYRRTAKRDIAREVSLREDDTTAGPAFELPDGEPTPGSNLLRAERRAALDRTLAELPEGERQSLVWRHEEECTFEEIGRRLGCSAVAARKRWLRALTRVRNTLSAMVR